LTFFFYFTFSQKTNMKNTEGPPNFFILVAIISAFLLATFFWTKFRPNHSILISDSLEELKEDLEQYKTQNFISHRAHSELDGRFSIEVTQLIKTLIENSVNSINTNTLLIQNELQSLVPPVIACACSDQDLYRAQEVTQFLNVRNEALYSLALPEIAKSCPYVSELGSVPESELQPFPTKSQRLIDYGKLFGLKTMVETGTYYGGTTTECTEHFDKLYTIELSAELYQSVSPKFDKTKVTALNGDSSILLKEQVLPNLNGPTIFWLDGHYSSYGTARGNVDTPIFTELMEILSHPLAAQFVLIIDDMRLFKGYTAACMSRTSEDVQCYPSIVDISEVFCAYQSHHKMNVRVEGDAVIAIGGDLIQNKNNEKEKGKEK